MILTLLTDFGLEDAYVGMMKGVALAIAPHATLIDLTHQVPPQDLWAARFNLMNAVPYFPPGTVHVAVVDPGVGSQRRGIAIQLPDCWLVGPDNGIFSGVLTSYRGTNLPMTVVALTTREYWRTPQPSTTFHGRDIFAPVAAHLATGVDIHQLGEVIDPATLVSLDLPSLQHRGDEIVGCVQYGDRFGNLITTIPADAVTTPGWSLTIGSIVIPGHSTYASVAPGQPVALVGSHGWVELAVNGGRAQTYVRNNMDDWQETMGDSKVGWPPFSSSSSSEVGKHQGNSLRDNNTLIGCPVSIQLL
ncbi:MAG: S-adenosyl-l-methionine hydroxide adenosyltransferase family protein [Leptolyngbyaceae cyanobacterium]